MGQRHPTETGRLASASLSRYYFDAHNGREARDDTGRDLPDVAAARREAVRIASAYAADPDRLIDEGVIVVTVRDAADAVVATVRLACMVEAA